MYVSLIDNDSFLMELGNSAQKVSYSAQKEAMFSLPEAISSLTDKYLHLNQISMSEVFVMAWQEIEMFS